MKENDAGYHGHYSILSQVLRQYNPIGYYSLTGRESKT